MIRTPWRREEEPSRAELARLLPDPGAPELPADRRLLLEEHLMRETERSAAPPARRRLVLAAVPVATAAVIVAAVTFTGGGEETGAASGGSTIQRLAAAAARQPQVEVAPGQFAYTAQYFAHYAGGGPNNGDNVPRDESGPFETETWIAPDGNDGWYVDTGQFPDGSPLIDGMPDWSRSVDAAAHDVEVEVCRVEPPALVDLESVAPDGTPAEEDCVEPTEQDDPANLHQPSWDYFQELTTDPEELLEKVYRENGSADSGDQADQWAFDTLGGFFEHAPLPPELAEATLLAIGDIPGVTVGAATDAAGREGVAVSRHGSQLGEETTFIFDEETGGYLGNRIEQIDAGHFHPAGTVFEDSALTDWAVVDELPDGLPDGRLVR